MLGLAPNGPLTIAEGSPVTLDRPFLIELAGSAGGRVRSAARLGAIAAIRCGLYVTQRDDYPVTVKTGHSLSKLIFSERPIDYATASQPDAVLVLTEDGLNKTRIRLKALSAGSVVYTIPEFAELDTEAVVEVIDPSVLPDRVSKSDLALVMLTAAVARSGVLPPDALMAVAADGPFADSNEKAIRAGLQLGSA